MSLIAEKLLETPTMETQFSLPPERPLSFHPGLEHHSGETVGVDQHPDGHWEVCSLLKEH